MKLVKEHINEKFEEDSDPIHDLGIGLYAEIKKYFEENKGPEYSSQTKDRPYDYRELDLMLLFYIENGEYNYVKYLLQKGANPNSSVGIHENDKYALPVRYAVFNDNFKMLKLLIEYGGKLERAGFKSLDEFKLFSRYHNISGQMLEFIRTELFQ